jgi:dienelactone hydrolase
MKTHPSTLLALIAGLALSLGAIAPSLAADAPGVGPVPQLPVKDFAQFPLIGGAVMSPDGKYLAASYEVNQTAGTNARFQLVVFALPGLKVTARLNFAPWRRPGGIVWVGPTRLVVSEAKVTGSLAAAQPTGDIIALNADGSQQRMLYSIAARGTPGASFNMMDMVNGSPEVIGPTEEMNGHVFIELHPFPMNTSTEDETAHRTILYDVDSLSGYPKKIAEIDKGQAEFFVHDDKPLMAISANKQLQEVVYLPDGQGSWKLAPAGVFGKVFEPLAVTPGSKGVYALYSAIGGPNELIRCNLDGSDKQVLASNSFGSVNLVLWSPRGEHHQPIAVTFTGTFKDGVPAVDYLSNDKWAQIHQALMKAFPGKFIKFVNMSTHGSTALIFAYSNSDPGEYALFDSKTMHLQPLMQLMPWFKSGQLAAREPIRFKNSQGLELDGFISFPVGVPHKNLPLVLLPHGGPIGIRDRWAYASDAEQLAGFLANRGYAVLQVDYRGSGGRGQNFQHLGYRQFATGIQSDLTDGVQWAIAKGYVDPNRICVFGASFGGYSSLMQPIVAPKLYKCAIDYAGVSDWRIEMDRSVYSHEASGNTSFAQYVGNRAAAKAISPLFMLDRFNVPVLIMQGGADNIVPPQNAERLRDQLESMHKPYEWLWFGNEYHGFQTEPHLVAMFNKVQAFLARYLGPGAGTTTH